MPASAATKLTPATHTVRGLAPVTGPRRSIGSSGIAVHADFNGDGYADMATGIDLRDVDGVVDAGAVAVVYGGPNGLDANAGPGNQTWTENDLSSTDGSETGDSFGRYMGGGDFNGDGYADLAVGIPLESVGTLDKAGAVAIIYGSANGLTAAGNQFWTQLGLVAGDTAEAGDWFGTRMQGGDFNGDGFEDLAVGAMFEDTPKPNGTQVTNAGSVDIIYGSSSGLTGTGAQFWTLDSPNIPDKAHANDLLGRAMGAGDFDGDGYVDLAIGAPHADVNRVSNAGIALVLYGSHLGLKSNRAQIWDQDSPGILDQCERDDWLGRTGITGGDFNGDGYDDLALGVFQESVGTIKNAGGVNVIYGSPLGLDANAGPGNQFWTEDDLSSTDGSEYGDRFGRSVEAADFNGDGYQDLSVGISEEDVGNVIAAGAVAVIYGSASGLVTTGNQWWNQDSPGILDQAEYNDGFAGRVPDVGDNNGDGYADIAIGVFKEDLGAIADAGAVNVIYGGPNGLDANAGPGNQFWTQDNISSTGGSQARDSMGQSNVG
jgi:hypothetical protein